MQRLLKAAVALDRVIAERGDEDGRRLVEGALLVPASMLTCDAFTMIVNVCRV